MGDLITKEENDARIQDIFNCEHEINTIENRYRHVKTHLLYLTDLCEENDIPQPEIERLSEIESSLFDAESFIGRARWNFDWEICIDVDDNEIRFSACNDEKGDYIECNFESIRGAFLLTKLFVLNVIYT